MYEPGAEEIEAKRRKSADAMIDRFGLHQTFEPMLLYFVS